MMDPETIEPGTTSEELEASSAAAVAEAATEPHTPMAMDQEITAEDSEDLDSDDNGIGNMHDLFVTSADDPLAAMREDPNYAALIKELEYIAAQARALFEPSQEGPSDDVWKKIESQLPSLNNDK